MSPAYAIKKGVRYRYYTSCLLAQGRKEEAGSVSRVSAMQIEQIVLEGLRQARGKSARHMTVATEVDIVAGVAASHAGSTRLLLLDPGLAHAAPGDVDLLRLDSVL